MCCVPGGGIEAAVVLTQDDRLVLAAHTAGRGRREGGEVGLGFAGIDSRFPATALRGDPCLL